MTTVGTKGNPDPRQAVMWSFFANPQSETYCNATRSAIAAGYSPKIAKDIVKKKWFLAKRQRLEIVLQSEKNLKEFTSLPKFYKKQITIKDPITKEKKKEIITVLDVDASRLNLDATKFALSTLGKKRYSTRIENTGAGGGPIKHGLDESEYDKIDKTLRAIVGDFKRPTKAKGSVPK